MSSSSSVASQTSTTSAPASFPSGPGNGGPGGPGTGTGNGNGGGGGGANAGGGNFNLAGSASLYLYTFLATLVLLLSVSAAIVIRSFILRRRHRLMVEEAIRNGTWVPPTPPTRAPRVDLSKKPALWEAYLGWVGNWRGGSHKGARDLGQGSGKGLKISDSWTFENSKDWEFIKPIYAGYVASGTSVPYSGPTGNLNFSPPVPIPVPAPITTLAPRGDEEQQQTTQASTRPSFLTRAKMLLSPTPSSPTSPLPASSASADIAANANRTDPLNMSMTELTSSSPPTVRVAVLIAMPSPPPSHRSSTSLSSSFSSSPSPNVPEPTTSDPLQQLSPSHALDDDEHPLPLLEMGVAEIAVGPSENSTSWDSPRRTQTKTYSRGSSYAEP